MKTIFFVRHGQSTANAGGITMAHDAIPLSELGRLQARSLADALELQPSAIYVSEYVRTHETAQPFCKKASIQPNIHPLLNEFSSIDPALIKGMNGEQRRPIADAYWQSGDPTKRMGEQADTFHEFEQRVADFISELDTLPDKTLIFGHCIWFGMLTWKLLGFNGRGSQCMKAFRRFQLGLPMPNCAVYRLESPEPGYWRARADEASMLRILSTTSTDRS
ncbi:histidine phosphatase family protein [Methylomonas fluvii]|uniref:Histidine phosphatase family protein n=1 Tax=Methylomonas fluvii TaxID=1854564 RepID=A0ABR9D965_9GAMM|nr:histidine phosphatase family protein [Methylomonas fluvii]MBD9359656.1 histidine phosphatase family protein [Methylomonas fluvii]CAD6872398.1 Phosphoglycerate mutase [Methylomonas fluvii]